jgi:TRAP-type C4-dicarboxylate transport system permease small subunit
VTEALRWLYRLETALLVLMLGLMLGLSAAQILLRNVFGTGLVWADVVVRLLVLWIGLAGAMVASRRGDHIRIDVAVRYLPPSRAGAVEAFTRLSTAFICGLAAWHGYRFARMEAEFGGTAFLQVPIWVCQTIIPFALGVIALRYFGLAVDLARKRFVLPPREEVA